MSVFGFSGFGSPRQSPMTSLLSSGMGGPIGGDPPPGISPPVDGGGIQGILARILGSGRFGGMTPPINGSSGGGAWNRQMAPRPMLSGLPTSYSQMAQDLGIGGRSHYTPGAAAPGLRQPMPANPGTAPSGPPADITIDPMILAGLRGGLF